MKNLFTVFFLSLIIIVSGCEDNITDEPDPESSDFRQQMRDFVISISSFGKGINNKFIVIPQNGHMLLAEGDVSDSPPALSYLNAISGIGREDLFYGYDEDNVATPLAETNLMINYLNIAKNKGIRVLVTDYCWSQSFMDNSYTKNADNGYISFAADHRELDNIPGYPLSPYNSNNADVISLADASNFLYVLNTAEFADKTAFLNALTQSSFDVLIIDYFFDDIPLTSAEVQTLKTKAGGGTRLVISYMSIGEAEDYRYYWKPEWKTSPPSWLTGENPEWPGNYKVQYWNKNWQDIIYGNDESYLRKILDAGFDGVYLDIIDAYEYFED